MPSLQRPATSHPSVLTTLVQTLPSLSCSFLARLPPIYMDPAHWGLTLLLMSTLSSNATWGAGLEETDAPPARGREY